MCSPIGVNAINGGQRVDGKGLSPNDGSESERLLEAMI